MTTDTLTIRVREVSGQRVDVMGMADFKRIVESAINLGDSLEITISRYGDAKIVRTMHQPATQ